MRTAVKSLHRKPSLLAWTLGAIALALAAAAAVSPAKADDGRRWSHHGHGKHHHLPPGQAKKHGHYHGYAPVYVYAPPPVVYVPRPVYYHPPQPGITIVFPIDLN